jgi:hypothetical protein
MIQSRHFDTIALRSLDPAKDGGSDPLQAREEG